MQTCKVSILFIKIKTTAAAESNRAVYMDKNKKYQNSMDKLVSYISKVQLTSAKIFTIKL